jgi:hypothetical protein
MQADSTLALSGTAKFDASDLQANTDASATSDLVTLSYAAVSDGVAEIKTGSGTTTISAKNAGDELMIDATLLDASSLLTQSGAGDQVVTGLVADISASTLTGELKVTTGDALDGKISISTGSANSSITAKGDGDTITINAGAMDADTTLAISGSARFDASDLQANTDASHTTAEVTLSYAAVSDGIAEITTGSGTTTISGDTSANQLLIDASKLDASSQLTQSGAADQAVRGLVADISAKDLSGELTVSTGDALDGSISITTGSNNTSESRTIAKEIITSYVATSTKHVSTNYVSA